MIKAVIFDLDGVLVSTDTLHFKAWKSLADSLGISGFTESDNVRQRGVSRMESLEVVLEKTDKKYSMEEKLAMAERKNEIYVRSLDTLSPENLLPGVKDFIAFLKAKSIKTAVGSVSRNTPLILEKTELAGEFNAVSCGLDTSKSKPDPDIFLIAARKLGVKPEECVVIEDSYAGIEAAKAGGMIAIAVGQAADSTLADYSAQSLDSLDYENMDIFKEVWV